MEITKWLKPSISASRIGGSASVQAATPIPTPSVTTGQAGKRTYLLVKRFDRTEVSGRWRRLHQEDYCQALGKPPSAKYEANQTPPGLRCGCAPFVLYCSRDCRRAGRRQQEGIPTP